MMAARSHVVNLLEGGGQLVQAQRTQLQRVPVDARRSPGKDERPAAPALLPASTPLAHRTVPETVP